MLRDRMAACGDRLQGLGARAGMAEKARLAAARRHLDGLARVLESVSHKSALARGFALVRGADGVVRRRAAAVKSGEALSLVFADGERNAVADAAPRPKAKKPADQGSLF
jgi:exodeoxyribonuclease VII large subunit